MSAGTARDDEAALRGLAPIAEKMGMTAGELFTKLHEEAKAQSARPPDFSTWVLDALDDDKRRHLILSWQHVAGRGIVVIGADMAENELRTEREAALFLAGVSPALTGFVDGQARR